MSEPIACNLAENALDYLILAGEQAKQGSPRMAKDGDPRMTKHALATLADGVELLLKAMLELRDWCLIFKDVDQASRPRYENGDFQSVTFEQALLRLKNLCSVEIPAKHLSVVSQLRQLRNRVRHFAVTTEREEAVSLLAKTFSFAIEFVTEHLEQKCPDVSGEMSQLRLLLGEFQEFVQERIKQIHTQIAAKDEQCSYGLDCPKCLQWTYYADAKTAHCLFCGYKCESELAAREWVDKFRPPHGGLPQIASCPKCGAKACVEETDPNTTCDVNYSCLSCGQTGFEPCGGCGKLFADGDFGGPCDCSQDT